MKDGEPFGQGVVYTPSSSPPLAIQTIVIDSKMTGFAMYYFDNGPEILLTEVREYSENGLGTIYIGTP